MVNTKSKHNTFVVTWQAAAIGHVITIRLNRQRKLSIIGHLSNFRLYLGRTRPYKLNSCTNNSTVKHHLYSPISGKMAHPVLKWEQK